MLGHILIAKSDRDLAGYALVRKRGKAVAAGTKRQNAIRKALSRLLPRVPMYDAEVILEVALSAHLRHLPPSIALWEATTARVRHAHTDYEILLGEGYDRDAARYFVLDDMNAVLADWGCARRVDAGEKDDDEEAP